MNTFNNPILPGFYPDPSVCRVNDDYYLVTSTFTYFPGIPIFHSKDLVHWNQIGNVLDRESQIPLKEGGHSAGIFAPTIRYHNGVFYVINTNVQNGGNFIVTSADPEGPWSEPYYLHSEGIDPSLFFDDDGRCYYCGTKDRREGAAFFGDNEIYIQELHLDTMTLAGESHAAWHGALRDAVWPEGPHIYKKDGWYYLLISEGGTGHDHAVSIARSRSVRKPFEGYRRNPIVTHRHLGLDYPIVNVGHPDLVETQKGEWWMILLASRPYGGYYRNLGRETFLVPVSWEDGWPVINPGKGIVENTGPLPALPYTERLSVPELESFDSLKLPSHFIFLRNPDMSRYSLSERPGFLRIFLSPVRLNELSSPSFICRRQQSMSFTAETRFSFNPGEHETAGLALFQSNEFYYSLIYTIESGVGYIKILKCAKGKEETLASFPLTSKNTDWDFKVHARYQDLSFFYKPSGSDAYIPLIDKVDGRILSTDVAGGFVGTCVGLFGTAKDKASKNHADFDWFSLVNLQ